MIWLPAGLIGKAGWALAALTICVVEAFASLPVSEVRLPAVSWVRVGCFMMKDINLRSTFNSEARLYHGSRPRYPETLFDTLIEVTHLEKNARLLEIGLGTGQATYPLAKRGYRITGVELGVDLAEVARESLKEFPNVEVITGAFEDVQFAPESFDLVYAATAIHWIIPEVRFTKPHNILKPNGYLVIIHTNHVSDEEGDKFFYASQPIYKKYQLANPDENIYLPRTTDLKPDELDDNLFKHVFYRAFPLCVRYTSNQYARLLNTYSPTLAMRPEMRGKFLNDISHLIDKKFSGSIIKHFAMTLTAGIKND